MLNYKSIFISCICSLTIGLVMAKSTIVSFFRGGLRSEQEILDLCQTVMADLSERRRRRKGLSGGSDLEKQTAKER